MIKNNFSRKAQEEMIGFALIIILVAVIMLVFLGFSLRTEQKENVESYEVESFLQSMLQYTTQCENNIEKLSVRKLIFSCLNREQCLNEEDSCLVLETELDNMLKESWKIGEERPVKGYELNIITEQNEAILNLKQGEITEGSKGSNQEFFRSNTLIKIMFKVYY